MVATGAAGKKIDVGRSTMVQATADGLWPHVTDLARWPQWLRDASGRAGLANVEKLSTPPGTVDPLQPELGQRYKLTFTNGLAGEFQVTYWAQPAQISLGLVRETRANSQGIEGLILDMDLFPRPGGITQLWLTATILLERGVKPGMLARWPRREVQAWIDGFHQRLGKEGPALAQGVKTRKQAEALLKPS